MSIRILNGGTPTPFPSVLNAPTNVTAGTPTSNSIPLTWTPSDQGDAIEYLAKDNSDDSTVASIAWPATGLVISGLDPDTEYSHYVVTSDGVKISPKSNVATARTAVAGDWQLAEGHYYDNQVITPYHLIYPRLDGGSGTDEVYSYVRHKWAHSQFKYQIPIGVQGGAPPYLYQLRGTAGVDYPVGMTLGSQYGDVGYGILSWTPGAESQNESWPIDILVTDQIGRPLNPNWTLELDDDMFRVQSTTGSPTGAGTWADPYADFLDWYGASVTAIADSFQKIMVYRGGTHFLSPNPGAGTLGNFELRGWGYKPMAHIGVPGETVIWNKDAVLQINAQHWSLGHNTYFADITIDGGPGPLVTTERCFLLNMSMLTMFNITFTNIESGSIAQTGSGTGTGNNDTCIYTPHIAIQREHLFLKNISTVGLDVNNNGVDQQMTMCTLYDNKYFLVESCVDSDSVGHQLVFWKAGNRYTTTRYCDFPSFTGFSSAIYHYQSNTEGHITGNDEICYNRVVQNGVDEFSRAISTCSSGTEVLNPVAVFRNTTEGKTNHRNDIVPANTANAIGNVAIYSTLSEALENFTIPSGETNVEETSATGVIDANGLLTDAYITTDNNANVRGTHGHEVK